MADRETFCSDILKTINDFYAEQDEQTYDSFILFALKDGDKSFSTRGIYFNVSIAMMVAMLNNLKEVIDERIEEMPMDSDRIH